MKNDLNDIKNILETQETKARSKEELEQELFKNMLYFCKNYANYIVGAIKFIGLTKNRDIFLNKTAKNQKEYDYLFMNYDKIHNKIKKVFQEDIKQEEQRQKIIANNYKQKKEPFTIFGIHWALVIFLFPVAMLMILLDDLK